MIVDWLIYGLFTWGLAALLNATAFSRRPADRWLAWTLTVAMFFLSLIAMTALQFFRYQAISQDLGVQVKPRSPLDVVGAFTFSWVFFAPLRKAARPRALIDPGRPAAAVSQQPHSVAAVAEPSAVTPKASPAAPPSGAEELPKPPHLPQPEALEPSEGFWAAALAEFESSARRPGLWARAFSEADGNEAIAKASYLRYRAIELQSEEQGRIAALRQAEESKNAALRQEAEEAQALKRETERAEAEHAYAALPKGVCPNHNCRAIIPLSSQACPKCGASFEEGAAWKVLPWRQT